jgi:hypothetical protein
MKRYEIWVNDTGEASHWKPVRGGFCFYNKDRALDKAKEISPGYAAVVVEQWSTGTNTYHSTIAEYK